MVLLGFILGAALVLFLMRRCRGSEYYRKVLSDLFVAGRIRQLAEDKSIDLGQEFEDYKSFNKKRNIHRLSLDETIESDLQDQITDEHELFDEELKDVPKE